MLPQTSTIAPAPTTATNVFYSRSTVIRSLLRGEEFTYVAGNEQDGFVRQTFTWNGNDDPGGLFWHAF